MGKKKMITSSCLSRDFVDFLKSHQLAFFSWSLMWSISWRPDLLFDRSDSNAFFLPVVHPWCIHVSMDMYGTKLKLAVLALLKQSLSVLDGAPQFELRGLAC